MTATEVYYRFAKEKGIYNSMRKDIMRYFNNITEMKWGGRKSYKDLVSKSIDLDDINRYRVDIIIKLCQTSLSESRFYIFNWNSKLMTEFYKFLTKHIEGKILSNWKWDTKNDKNRHYKLDFKYVNEKKKKVRKS